MGYSRLDSNPDHLLKELRIQLCQKPLPQNKLVLIPDFCFKLSSGKCFVLF